MGYTKNGVLMSLVEMYFKKDVKIGWGWAQIWKEGAGIYMACQRRWKWRVHVNDKHHMIALDHT